MKATLFLTLLLATAAFAITKTYSAGTEFHGTVSRLGSRLYNVTIDSENLGYKVNCYPKSVQAAIPVYFSFKRRQSTWYYYCPESSPHFGITVGSNENTTITINEYPVVEYTNSTAPSDSLMFSYRFPVDGFLLDDKEEYMKYLGIQRDFQYYVDIIRETTGTILVYTVQSVPINPTGYVTPILEDGESFNVTLSPGTACGKLPSNTSGYEFEGSSENSWRSGKIIQNGNQVLVCRTNLPLEVITFRVVTPTVVTSFTSFNCSSIRYATGQMLFATIPAPVNQFQIVLNRYQNDDFYHSILFQAYSFDVCRSEGTVNVSISQPTLRDPVTLTAEVSQEFITDLPPLGVNAHIIKATELGSYNFNLNNSGVELYTFDSERSPTRSIFNNDEGIIIFFNPTLNNVVVAVTASKMFGPSIDVNTSNSFEADGLINLGPLVIFPAADICVNITFNTTSYESYLGYDMDTLYSRDDGRFFCRYGPSDANFHVGLYIYGPTQVSVTRPVPIPLALNVSTAVGPTTVPQIFSYPAPSEQFEDNIAVFDYSANSLFSPLQRYGFEFFPNGAQVLAFNNSNTNPILFHVVAPAVADPTSITFRYLTVSPSCDQDSDCSNSACDNGKCGICNEGYQGYGCLSIIPSTTAPETTFGETTFGLTNFTSFNTASDGVATNVKPSSAGSLSLSILLLLAALLA